MRLDLALVSNSFYPSRAKAVAAIRAGLVTVNGVVAAKPSMPVADDDEIVAGSLSYVSGRGSLKLQHALDVFGVNPGGKVCLDVGASTGGFTEVLLNAGAERVYAVDVGTDQLVPELRENSRVVSLEQTDIRTLPVQQRVALIVIDVSFVSLADIVVSLVPWGADDVIALIKPQFEVPREVAAKFNGVIRSEQWHRYSIERVEKAFVQSGFKLMQLTQSPISGGSGNIEYLAWFKPVK